MSGQARKKQIAAGRKRVTKRDRKVTDRETSDLLESASQALSMARGSKLVGGRISVRQVPAEAE